MLVIGKWYTIKVWKNQREGVAKKKMKLISIHNNFARFASKSGWKKSYNMQDVKMILEGGVIHE